MAFTPPLPPRSTPPHWSHWLPVTPTLPPPIPFLNPITLSPASLLPYLQWLLLYLLPPPPRFRSAPAPVSSLFLSAPTIFGGPVSPPSLRALTEGQNRLRCNELRDRILSPEDRWPHPHDPRVLYCSRQGEVLPLPVPPSAWKSPRQPPSDPDLEGVQGRSIFPVSTQDSAPKRRTCCVTAM